MAMRKPFRVNKWVMIALCAGLLICFYVQFSDAAATIGELNSTYAERQHRLAFLKNEQAELKEKAVVVRTESYIESHARSLGYMKPDEIRFVITNPQVLYGDEEIPSR